MIQATFKVSAEDLTSDLLEKIKSLFPDKNFEVDISIKPKETLAEAKERIDRSIENIEQNKNLVAFSPEEYEALVRKLSKQ